MRGDGGSCGVSANKNSCAHHVTWSPNKHLTYGCPTVTRTENIGDLHKKIFIRNSVVSFQAGQSFESKAFQRENFLDICVSERYTYSKYLNRNSGEKKVDTAGNL